MSMVAGLKRDAKADEIRQPGRESEGHAGGNHGEVNRGSKGTDAAEAQDLDYKLHRGCCSPGNPWRSATT